MLLWFCGAAYCQQQLSKHHKKKPKTTVGATNLELFNKLSTIYPCCHSNHHCNTLSLTSQVVAKLVSFQKLKLVKSLSKACQKLAKSLSKACQKLVKACKKQAKTKKQLARPACVLISTIWLLSPTKNFGCIFYASRYLTKHWSKWAKSHCFYLIFIALFTQR